VYKSSTYYLSLPPLLSLVHGSRRPHLDVMPKAKKFPTLSVFFRDDIELEYEYDFTCSFES
jgi:hypothetical protein